MHCSDDQDEDGEEFNDAARSLHLEEESGEEDDAENDTDEENLLTRDQVINMLLLIYTTHNVTMLGMGHIVKLINALVRSVRLADVDAWKRPLPTFRSMKEGACKRSPDIKVDYEYLDKQAGTTERKQGERIVPLKLVANKEEFALNYTFTYVHLPELLHFHTKQHESPGNEVILAFDNVPVCKSTGESFDVVSIQFPTCHRVYPYRVFHGAKGVKMDMFRNLRFIMHELMALGLTVKHIISDLPKRASLMGLRQHGGYYACGQCLCPGEYSRLSGTMVYPVNRLWPKRTAQGMNAIVEDQEFENKVSDPERFRHELQGIKGRTPLFDLPDFDVTNQIPTDSMHCVYLGVVRKLMYRTFNVSDPSRGQQQPRMPVKLFNQLYVKCKIPTENSRKTRDFTVFWKASEYRALIHMHFPTLIQTLLRHPSPEKKILLDVWCSLVFIVIYVHGPPNDVIIQYAREAMAVFTQSYTTFFGEHSINLNVHLLSHLLDTHAMYGDLNDVSAIRSEAMYQIFLTCFKAGTRNVSTQGMMNVFLKYQLSHSCQRRLVFRSEETGRKQDNYVYTKGFQVYRIVNVMDASLICCEVTGHNFSYVCENGTRLDFTLFGTYKGPFEENPVEKRISKSSVVGKVLMRSHYCVCVPKATLLSGYY